MKPDIHQRTILTRKLVPVGGRLSQSGSVVIWMHGGYDRPLLSIEAYCRLARNLPADGVPHLVSGSRANPAFSWPVYASRTAK